MKPDIILHLLLSALILAGPAPNSPNSPNDIQHTLTENPTITMSGTKQGVPGHNSVFYGPIPKTEQIFNIEFLEIAPSPIPVNKSFSVLLRGSIPPSTQRKLHLTPSHLASATISITLSAVLENDEGELEPITYTIPLKTAKLAEGAHLGIRNFTGAYVEHLTLEGQNDILTDFWIPGPFVKTGLWTFEIVASLGGDGDGDSKLEGKGICLFALTLTQWLEGNPGW